MKCGQTQEEIMASYDRNIRDIKFFHNKLEIKGMK